jgi:hypothetical protein
MNFRRPLSQEEGGQWDKLIVHLEGVQIGEGKDNISGGWIWGGGVVNIRMKHMWKSKLPLRLRSSCGWFSKLEYNQGKPSRE